MKVILIDDEISALKTLEGMLTKFCPQVEILAKATTITEGWEVISSYRPNVIFLDIEMPPDKGFDLLNMIPERTFGVIITTAYSEYAIQAINDAQPWGFLVKPYRVSDLSKVVQIAEAKIQADIKQIKASPGQKEPKNRSIMIADRRKGNIIIRVENIFYCQADRRTTDIFHLKDNRLTKITSSHSLKTFQAQLPEHSFCRIHHSYLVNMHRIIRYQKTGRNGKAYLSNDIVLEISVLKMKGFEERFKQLLEGK